MKICYIASSNIPSREANSIQVMRMCEAFENNGLSVKLLIPHLTTQDERVSNLWEYYGIIKKFSIVHIPYPLPFSKKKFKEKYFGLWSSLYSKLLKPDFVYTRLLWAVNWCLKFGIPVVFEAHKFHQYKRSLAFPYFRKNFSSSNLLGIVVVSCYLEESYKKEGFPHEKIFMAPNGVDLKKFRMEISKHQIRKELRLPLRRKIITYSGHLNKTKGIDTILNCAFLMEDCLFLIVGGWDKDVKERKREVRNRGLKNVLFTGFVPPSQVNYYLIASDVLILPYTIESTKEHLCPLKLFEYMASERPIVASDIPTIKEILRDGKNAKLVKPDSPLALKEGIEKVLKDKNLSRKISKQARIDVEEYSWERRAQKIINFIKGKL